MRTSQRIFVALVEIPPVLGVASAIPYLKANKSVDGSSGNRSSPTYSSLENPPPSSSRKANPFVPYVFSR